MNSLENLKRYRDDYYKILEISIKIQKVSQSEVDAILDRINEMPLNKTFSAQTKSSGIPLYH